MPGLRALCAVSSQVVVWSISSMEIRAHLEDLSQLLVRAKMTQNQQHIMASQGEPAWAWLGLLKWSLAYSDGTRPSDETMTPMSDEDKAFLEAVMKDGIIDENERMKTILKEVTESLEAIKAKSEGKDVNVPLTEEEIDELLLELRDIVEQIDYARAFAAMKGLPFLLGCASERNVVPRSVRISCLGILATMCQNNPPVQIELLNLGSLKTLTEIYFAEYPQVAPSEPPEESNGQVRSKVVQAMSANVRNNADAEDVFCQIDEARRVLASALGLFAGQETLPPPPVSLRKRSLFFLRALVTSDTSTMARVRLFDNCIGYVCDNFVSEEQDSDADLREMSLGLIEQILTQKHSVNAVLDRKDALVATGVRRVAAIREMHGEERACASIELELWEDILVLLARAQRDDESAAAPALTEDSKPGDNTQTLAQ